MALVAGTVTIDAAGVATGSGLALAFARAELNARDALYEALGQPAPPPTAAARDYFEAKAKDYAEAIVAAIGAADVRVPKDALAAGVPAAVTVLGGAVE
jgi:hypothetical protein